MGVGDKLFGNLFLDYKEIVVYGLGIGATLIAPVLGILSPLLSFIFLLSYNSFKKIDKGSAKRILIIIFVWIVILPAIAAGSAYAFNTTFASFIFGLCIVKILEKRRLAGAVTGYLGATTASIFSSVVSLNYSFYIWLFEREIPNYTSSFILRKLVVTHLY